MSYLEALILGIIQGIVEFFPISSSGHLIAYQALRQDSGIYDLALQDRIFDAVVQIGSGIALFLVFLRKLLLEQIPFFDKKNPWKCCVALIVASLPVIICGVVFHSYIKTHLYTPYIVAWMWIFGGILFLIAEERAKKRTSCNFPTQSPYSFGIGLFQAVALIPGVSRSGATIMGAELLGISRKNAVLFSFFIAIPILIGAGSYDLVKALLSSSSISLDIPKLMIGAFSAFIASLCIAQKALDFLIRYGIAPFGWYRIIAGCVLLWLLLLLA